MAIFGKGKHPGQLPTGAPMAAPTQLAGKPPAKITKWPFYLIMLVLALFILVLGVSQMTRPSFCSTCHAMKPYYRAWQRSAHKKVSCLACHQEPGPQGYVRTPLRALSNLSIQSLYYNRFRPIHAQPIANSNCTVCHQRVKDKLIGGALKISHQGIETQGFLCATCHPSAGHLLKHKQRAPLLSKTTCLNCHDGRVASARCSLCHTQDIGWKPDQLQDYALVKIPDEVCASCHPAINCAACHQAGDS